MSNYYDKVAKQFGGYGFSTNIPKYTSEYPNGDPETVFKEKLLELATPYSVALDIGCGDGRFVFEIANHFSKIIGLDSSKELIAIAQQKKKAIKVKNISFIFGDAANTPFEEQSFDIIFNRRGPSFYGEYTRVLKTGGHYVEVGIGEQDAMALKKTFGRGQNFGTWNTSRIETDREEFEKLGLKPILLANYAYNEQYLSKYEFELFLQGVPIFEDFNLVNDRKFLEAYYKDNMSRGRVTLTRHRVVYVLMKC